MMDRKYVISLFFVALLLDGVILHPLDDVRTEEHNDNREKRAVFVLPAVYYGAVISAELFTYLAAIYTAYEVSKAISRVARTDSHSCADNRGWCRDRCFRHEYIDWVFNDVCGDYVCCRPGNI